eukprot:CAMPEP_0202357794 /NCGR_PEP_ID=MMETSP1126-20121109/11682_1 /ASSEMBLY_ACC=CAM_ASM_000457 /TAXON_ID=3047 /ORGANISM="Dunaliella tertiolecta, Strain CCMP1320" /LENGTH=330 /DNA_ID=CAMNT_0048950753 /DNA_START=163 /DNA_END=1155 /DNA_ORIENTATION=-
MSCHAASPSSSSQPSSLAPAPPQLRSQPATDAGPLSSEHESSDTPSQSAQHSQPKSAAEQQPASQQEPVSPQPATSAASPPGAETAFTPGLEGASRRMLFNRISKRYDELNDRLSFGQHWVWKRMAVKWSNARRGHKVLDVCCGSGDIGLLLADVVGPQGQVVGLDFASDMLADAANRQRALEAQRPATKQHTPIQWVQGDAMDLPFGSGEFHAATMGYGLRNVASIPAAMAELHRVLKPGGKVAILDFNNSQDPLVDRVQAFFLESIVVPAAREYGLEAEYKYLRPSIKNFPTGREQEALAKAAGFQDVVHYPIGFGLMGVLVATKGRN